MVSVLVIVLTIGAGWWVTTLRPDTRPPLAAALNAMPVGTNVVGFTDWKQIRASVGLGTVDTVAERDELADAASLDLTTRSVVGRDIEEMHDVLGWSPADVDWEVYGQDADGAAAVFQLGRSVSFDDIEARLAAAGFRREGDLWTAAERTAMPDFIAQVALVPRKRLVVASNIRGQIAVVRDVIAGRASSLADSPAAAATAEALAGSDSVILQTGASGCESTALPDDPDLDRQARTAIERAGGLRTYGFSGRAIVHRGGSGFSASEVRFAMTFDSAAVASRQAAVRARLAEGPFIGRTGDVDDTLRLRTATSDDSTVRMAFDHDLDTGVFMTGLGPILFATCPVQ